MATKIAPANSQCLREENVAEGKGDEAEGESEKLWAESICRRGDLDLSLGIGTEVFLN